MGATGDGDHPITRPPHNGQKIHSLTAPTSDVKITLNSCAALLNGSHSQSKKYTISDGCLAWQRSWEINFSKTKQWMTCDHVVSGHMMQTFYWRNLLLGWVSEWVISNFTGTPTPKGSHSAKTRANCTMSPNRVHQKRISWSNECKVQGKTSSHILKKKSNSSNVQ